MFIKLADRAKHIKVHATINESSTDKLIRQLKEENERLTKAMERGVVDLNSGSGVTLSEKGKII